VQPKKKKKPLAADDQIWSNLEGPLEPGCVDVFISFSGFLLD
jgi:hypothetical protein